VLHTSDSSRQKDIIQSRVVISYQAVYVVSAKNTSQHTELNLQAYSTQFSHPSSSSSSFFSSSLVSSSGNTVPKIAAGNGYPRLHYVHLRDEQ